MLFIGDVFTPPASYSSPLDESDLLDVTSDLSAEQVYIVDESTAAALGYGLAALALVPLAVARSWPVVLGARFADRGGLGIRVTHVDSGSPADKVGISFKSASSVPSGNAANAASVGANRVKGPSARNVS